ncbi:MAG: hypothetical protein R3B40_27770 [Polyangiales bacterium]
MDGLRARLGRDCAARVRVSYSAPRALTLDDVALLPEAEVRVSEFSAHVAGARDHVQLRVGDGLTASYAVGDTELRVVYGKLGGAVPHALMQHVERRLVARFGPLAWEPGPSCA